MKVHAANVRSHPARPAHATRAKKREYLYAEGPARAMRILLERAARRLTKQITRAKAYGLPERLYIVANMENAVVSLIEAVKGLDSVPFDWRPAKGSLGWNIIAEGTITRIRPTKRAEHMELLDASAKLRIVRVVGGKAVCEVIEGDDAGTRFSIPCTHLIESGKPAGKLRKVK